MRTVRTVVLPIEFHPALEQTLAEASKAYRMLSETTFREGVTSRGKLQRLAYASVRAATSLTAQMTCSAIRHVVSAYKSAKSNGRRLEEPASFSSWCLDLQGGARGRDFKIYPDKGVVSVSTVEGRKKLRYRAGHFQRRYLEDPSWKVRAARLLYKRRKRGCRYELHVSLEREVERKVDTSEGVLGVDTGRRYLAVATTGNDARFFKAGHIKPKKEHLSRLRGRLKSKGTRSSTRTYHRVSGREARLTKDFQHGTAKALVELAEENGCGTIAVERLNGIRKRTGAKGPKARYHHGTWAYARFLKILRYKAEGAGLEVVEVDPANTSRACSTCGYVDRCSRKGLSFVCGGCGYSLHADLNAARNIRLRAILGKQALAQDGPNQSCGPEAELGEAETAKRKSGRTEAESHGKLPALVGST